MECDPAWLVASAIEAGHWRNAAAGPPRLAAHSPWPACARTIKLPRLDGGWDVRAAAWAIAMLLALGVDRSAAQVTSDPNQSSQPFSAADLLGGVRMTQAQCLALGDRAVW